MMRTYLMQWYAGVVSAYVYARAAELPLTPGHGDRNRVVRFIVQQHAGMPDFLRWPMVALTLGFDLFGLFLFLRPFCGQSVAQRSAQISCWKESPLGPFRDFVRFYDSLFTVAWSDPHLLPMLTPASTQPKPVTKVRIQKPDAIVVGSGPGGAITGALLAEAGLRVVMLEEGLGIGEAATHAFTVQEMVAKYRNGGLTPAMGSPKVAYVEGKCAGGGSEINSGLYHRTPAAMLRHWQQHYNLAISEADLTPHYAECERAVSVSYLPEGTAPAASLKLQSGADAMGWHCQEVPRWFTNGERQSMSRTFLKRFLSAGGELLSRTRCTSVERASGRWAVETEGTDFTLAAPHLFLSGGAIGTPALLQRSRLGSARGTAFGQNLQMHPTIKVVALFDEEVNSESMGVPVHQVKEFAPDISMGCAISSESYLAMAMLDHPRELHRVRTDWRRMAIYYAMIVPEGRGAVRTLPGCRDPLVTFKCTNPDLYLLSTALKRLCRLLFAAGAVRLYPTIAGCPAIGGVEDLRKLPACLPAERSNLMTIHLMSSCAAGENAALCPIDSLGRVVGQSGLYVADGSLLPSAPGVNPQGSIMAFSHRNATAFLQST